MNIGWKAGLGLGAGAAAIVGGGTLAATKLRAQSDEPYPYPYDGSPVDPATDYPTWEDAFPGADPYPGDEPYPGEGPYPGDDPLMMPIRGTIDPPGWWNDHQFDGMLSGERLDATIDPEGWGNDVRLTGRVSYGGFETRIDPRGWGNDTTVSGVRDDRGFEGEVDRPGPFNTVRMRIDETVRGAEIIRDGRFDERFTSGFSEARWRSAPAGEYGDRRMLEFDPPGWGNTTEVTIDANAPAGAEATIASHLYSEWKTEQERMDDYPDVDNDRPTGAGDEY